MRKGAQSKGVISFLEMVQQYPIGTKVNVMKEKNESQREIIGYEYYNSTGYLLFRDNEKINVESLEDMGFTKS